jgi:hypothetical protein
MAELYLKLPNGGELYAYDNGDEFYYLNGKYHREDGPAISYSPYEVKEWWINGYHIPCKTQKQFEQFMRLKAFW